MVPGSTYDLGSSQGNLLVALLVLHLNLHVLDTLVDLVDVVLKLLDCGALALCIDFASLVLLLVLVRKLVSLLETLIELLGLHFLLAIILELLVVLLELLGDLLTQLFDFSILMLLDPLGGQILGTLKVLGTLLLLDLGIDVDHHHLGSPYLITKTVNLHHD
jgi:hypothetical protein